MARALIGAAGGAGANNFIMSLRATDDGDHLIGMCATAEDLMLADVDERYMVPLASDPSFPERLEHVIERARPDFIHSQHDGEVRALSRRRDILERHGVKHLLPAPETVELCVDKARSYERWSDAGVPVPETLMVADQGSLREAFRAFGGKVWLRATEGAGGRGAVPTDDLEFARRWIDRFDGWGHFMAARQLTSGTVTWLSIWYRGELIVAQARERLSWKFGAMNLSGVTGITGIGETCSDAAVDDIALRAIEALDRSPHGIFAVDMTYDEAGHANVTEINIARFFSTHHFFTQAGLNFPKIYRDLTLHGRRPTLEKKINPLPDGLVWIRGMDVAPVLTDRETLRALEDWR
jgi:carbamoyl-phosphate synthase large subunit